MKEKTDEELKQIFNLTDQELHDLRIIDKREVRFVGDEYDLFKYMKELKFFKITSPNFEFYYINGVRVNKKKWDDSAED